MAGFWSRLRRADRTTPEQTELLAWMSRSRILADQVDAALRISGADRSNWQPPIYLRTDPKDTLHGVADWDGTIQYHQDAVIEALRELEDNGGRPATPEQLDRWRHALHIVLHENVHLLSAHDRTHKMARDPFRYDKAVRALEEGVTELWTAKHLSEYIDALGAERYAPRLKTDEVPVIYPQYVGAVAALTQGIGADSGLDADEVLDRLNREDGGRKWEVLTELAMSRSGLDAERIPARQYKRLVTRVERQMKSELFRLGSITSGGQRALLASAAAGNRAVAAAREEIRAAQRKYGVTPPERITEQQAEPAQDTEGRWWRDDPTTDLQQAAAAAWTGTEPLDHAGPLAGSPAVGTPATGGKPKDGPAATR